jgi:hypothetical protein
LPTLKSIWGGEKKLSPTVWQNWLAKI